MSKLHPTTATAFLVLLGSCGPSNDVSFDAGPPVGDTADARIAPPPAVDAMPPDEAPQADCPADLPADFGTLGLVETTKNDIGGHLNVFSNLLDDERWFLAMNFHPGRGIFAGGISPGTYVLAGPDLDVQFCALCINLFADHDNTPGGPSQHMVPRAATVVIDSVVGAEVSGRLEEVEFSAIDVTYDGMACGEIEDPICVNTICLSNSCGRQTNLQGCVTTVGTMDF